MLELRIDLDAAPAHRTLRILKARGIGHPLEALPVVIDHGRIRMAGTGRS